MSFGHIYPIGLERVSPPTLSDAYHPTWLEQLNAPFYLRSVVEDPQHVYNYLQLGSVNRRFATFTNIYNSGASQIFGTLTNIYN